MRIFRTGLVPAATYDAPVWGMADAEVASLRKLAATALSPRAPGRSLRLALLWHDVPTADAEHGPALQYFKMTWRAATRREEAMMRHSSLADIRRAWEAAQVEFQPLVEAIAAARGPDGSVPKKVAKAAWGRVRGPIAAAALTLARLGWRFTAPFTVEGANGVEHCITGTSPALLRDALRDALRDSLEREVGASIARRDPQFEGRRVCLDLARSAAKPGAKLDAKQAAAFRAAACGAIWTATTARERGYDTDGLCTLCGQAPDTLHHRTYACPRTADAVRAVVPEWFWKEAARASPTDTFWTRGLFPHPADLPPPPPR